MGKKPKVSILCITYNQSKYIKQALESFLKQETTFEYEILINDDASDDGTREILLEYSAKYPHKIKLNLQKHNLYSQGVRNMFIRFLMPKAVGKYIALCEGDDYWTDPHKLQKQVDFLEANDDYALCFHPVKVHFENSEDNDHIFPSESKASQFTIKKLLKDNFIQTNSVVYRKQHYNNLEIKAVPGDWYLHLYHAQFGKIGFINKVMSVYRRHAEGIWWSSYKEIDEMWRKNGVSYFYLYEELLKIYGGNPEYAAIIRNQISDMFNRLVEVDKKFQSKLIYESVEKFPENTAEFIAEQHDELVRIYKENMQLARGAHHLQDELNRAQQELGDIKSTKAWKAYSRAKRMGGSRKGN